MIWKVLVPAYLNGMNPVWIGMAITVFLTGIIILFVYGLNGAPLWLLLALCWEFCVLPFWESSSQTYSKFTGLS